MDPDLPVSLRASDAGTRADVSLALKLGHGVNFIAFFTFMLSTVIDIWSSINMTFSTPLG